MSYSKLYFGKELHDLAYRDIEDFFLDERDESDKIEFKSYHSQEEKNHSDKENGVIRAICALLNSEGGIVIWGAPIGQKVPERKEKVFKGALSPADRIVEKDAFISRITDLVTPSPKGIKFLPLERDGEYVFVVEVERSPYAPHQFRNIYYMRIDGQTKPAPHHYIEALFRKITFPKLAGHIVIDSIAPRDRYLELQITAMVFNLSKLQNEHDVYCRILLSSGRLFAADHYKGTKRIYPSHGGEMREEVVKATLYYNEPINFSERIIFDQASLSQNNGECEIFLVFGGKYSPLMVSEYKLTLANLAITNKNDLIMSMTENKYFYEKSDEMQLSENEKMKRILGR